MARVGGVLSHVPRTHSGCAEGQYCIERRYGNQGHCCQAAATAEGWVSENEGAACPGHSCAFLLCDSKKGHFHLLEMGVWVDGSGARTEQ